MKNKEMVDLQVYRLVFNSTQPEATPSEGNQKLIDLAKKYDVTIKYLDE